MENSCPHSLFDAFYEHILFHMMFLTTMLVLSCVFSLFSVPYLNTLAMHTTNQLTAHVEKTREHLNNYHCTSHENGEMVRAAPLSNRRCFAAHGQLETRSQQTQSHRHHPAPTAMQTQPLSKWMLRACAAYQRTRQRNTGIVKKSYQGF